MSDEATIFTGPILSPPAEFRDEATLVLENMEWESGFLNDVFGEMASLEDLTCDIDMPPIFEKIPFCGIYTFKKYKVQYSNLSSAGA